MNKKYALIGHHLSLDQLYQNKPGFKWQDIQTIKQKLALLPPERVTDLKGVRSILGNEIDGFGIAVNLLPEQFYELPSEIVINKIVEAIELAKSQGAGIVVLGAATSIIGNQGTIVAKRVKDIAITTGNAYTAATVIEAVKQAAKLINLDIKKAKMVVVGATGSIGAACCHILSEKVKSMVIIARNKRRLETLAGELAKKAKTEISFAEEKDINRSVADADITIMATSAPYALVDAKDFKSGSLVCDVAVPRNVSLESGEIRKDVLIIDGGLIKPPGKLNRSSFEIGVPAGFAPACLCEGMILALEGRFENFTIGTGIEIDKVKEVFRLGEKHGFKMEAFRSFGKPISKEYIETAVAARKI